MSDMMTDAELASYNLTRRHMDQLKKDWACATDRDVLRHMLAKALVAAKRADDDALCEARQEGQIH